VRILRNGAGINSHHHVFLWRGVSRIGTPLPASDLDDPDGGGKWAFVAYASVALSRSPDLGDIALGWLRR
jgi:hypothetical protein